MAIADSTAYHLSELKIARDPHAPGHILPPLPRGCRAVLDIGCGAGQTLIALGLPSDALVCGIDPDVPALLLGKELSRGVRFAAALGESLPYADGSFDLVFSRVALPYTNVPVALAEIARVLRPGGTVWLTLHPPRMVLGWMGQALRERNLRRIVFLTYVLANGALLGLLGRQVAWPGSGGRHESCQTAGSIRRALRRVGLATTSVSRGRFFVVTGRKGPAAAGDAPPLSLLDPRSES